jgi:predicted  nucleic acid-binding Zn-ribbon protein
MGGSGEKDGALKEELVDTIASIEAKINETDSRIKLLISEVGFDDLAFEKGLNSLWSTISSIQAEVKKIDNQVVLIYETMLNVGDDKQRIGSLENDRDSVKKKLSVLEFKSADASGKLHTLDNNYKKLYGHCTESMKEIYDAIRKLNGQGKQGVTTDGPTL